MAEQRTDSDDTLWGAKAFADEIGRPVRQTFYLLERGLIPARKIGNAWVGSRRKVRAHLSGDGAA
jgi:hypothetical protein